MIMQGHHTAKPAFGQTRRGLMGAALGAGAFLAAGGARAGLGAEGSIADPLATFVRMRSGPGGAYSYWAYSGVMFGRPQDQSAMPLFNIVGIGIGRFTARADGGYEHVNNEVGYYTDLKTGAPLTAWRNPLNGAMCVLAPYKSRQAVVYRPDSTIAMPEDHDRKVEGYGVVPPPRVQGRSLWMSEDLFAKVTPNRPGPGRQPTVAASLASFRIDIADLKAPADEMIPAQLYYETLNSWRPAMRMGDAPGIISTRMTADKAADASQLSLEVAGWMRRDYPGFLETGL